MARVSVDKATKAPVLYLLVPAVNDPDIDHAFFQVIEDTFKTIHRLPSR